MQIRRAKPGEEAQLWQLFHDTVHQVNRQDYTSQQLQAWAPDNPDAMAWELRIQAMRPFVCIEDSKIIGYAGLLESGHIDHFYVHHRWQRRGVGQLLFSRLLEEAIGQKNSQLTVDVSITARPFFQSQGFAVVAEQEVQREGVSLTNFKMVKKLLP